MLPRTGAQHTGPSPLLHAWPLLLWALPGVPLGAVALAQLPEDALAIVVSVAVLAALVLLERTSGGVVPRWSAPAAGLAAGALTASTSINGPPLVLHLLRSGVGPAESRGTLAVCFLVLDAGGLIALAIGGVFDAHPSLPLLLAGALAGQRVGARLATHTDPERWTAVTKALLAVSAVALAAGAAL